MQLRWNGGATTGTTRYAYVESIYGVKYLQKQFLKQDISLFCHLDA